MKKILLSLLIMGVAACSSTPTKPPMTEEWYLNAVTILAGSQVCLAGGKLDPQIYAEIQQVAQYRLSTISGVDYARIDREVMAMSLASSATTELCNTYEGNARILINKYNNEMTAKRRKSKQQGEAINDMVDALQPTSKNTWCNKVGSTVMCN